MTEPRWRTVMCWGVVITYLTAPLVVFIIHLNASPELDKRIIESHGIRDFYVSVAGLLVSLAGLNTYQVVSNGRKPEAKDKSQ